LIAYDTEMAELAATAVSFYRLQQDIERRLARNARVMVITDACHSGKMADAHAFHERVQKISGDVFGLLAAAPEESSLEGKIFGGGHGAFTYHLLRGLQGDADINKDGAVDFSEASSFLQKTVPTATRDRQHPQPFGKPSVDFTLSLVNQPRADLGFNAQPQTLL